MNTNEQANLSRLRIEAHDEEKMLVAHCLANPYIAKRVAAQLSPTMMSDMGTWKRCIAAIVEVMGTVTGTPARSDIQGAIEPIIRQHSGDSLDFVKLYKDALVDHKDGEFYMRRIIDRFGRRALLQLDMSKILRDTFNVSDAMGKVRQELLDITRETSTATGRGGLLIQDYYENVEALAERLSGKKIITHQTGLKPLDEILGGVAVRSYNVVGARPSVGKTSTLNNLVLLMAKAGIRVMMITLEVDYDVILEQMACCHDGLKKHLVKSAPSLSTKERLFKSFEEIHKLPIELHADCSDISKVMALIEDGVTREKNPIQVAFVDYFQIVETNQRYRDEVHKLNAISSQFREFKKTHEVALFIAAQLNRQAADNRAPKMEDLKGTGNIEQDADTVILLDRPFKEMSEREESTPGMERTCEDDQIDFYVRKNRYGRTGKASMHWDGATGRIVEYTDEEAEQRRKARVAAERAESKSATDRRSSNYRKGKTQRPYSDGSMDSEQDLPF